MKIYANQSGQNDQPRPETQRLADLAMMLNRGKSQNPSSDTGPLQTGRPNSNVLFTPVELDIFRLALRREPQRARELFRQQAGQIMAAINRIRSAPNEQRTIALAAELQKFPTQSGHLNEMISQVPLQRVDQLLDFLEQRAAGLLQMVDDDDRLDQLDEMLSFELEPEDKGAALTKQTFDDAAPAEPYEPVPELSSSPEESEEPEES